MRRFLTLLFFFCLLACACATKQKEYRIFLASVDEHQTQPVQAVLNDNTLYIRYLYDDKQFYLKADVSQKNKKPLGTYYRVKLSAAKNIKSPNKYIEQVSYISSGFGGIVKELFSALMPQGAGKGVIVIIQGYEGALYRDLEGKANFKLLTQIPSYVEITDKISEAAFAEKFIAAVKKHLQKEEIRQTKFLIPTNNKSSEPYIFLDTEKNLITTLVVPDYFELKKQMSDLGFSAAFVYSLFIKSHIFGIVKAPFTSTFRLFSLGMNSIYAATTPLAKEAEQYIPPVEENAQGMDLNDFNSYLDKYISKKVYKANAELLINGNEFFPHFLVNAAKAEKSIFIRLYIFTTDMYSLSIADMLKRKSQEGVKVKVIIDDLNSVLNNKKKPTYYSKNFIMPRSIAHYLKKKSKIRVRKRLNTWGTFDHSKVILIDGDLAYTGGMNFGEEYRYQWHDLMIALRGPITQKLHKDFRESWAFNGHGGDFSLGFTKTFGKKKRHAAEETQNMINIRLFYTTPYESQIFRAHLEAIKRAKKRIYIENAYFSDDRIVKHLIDARLRGVDVRVILPSENDIPIMHENNLAMANKLWRNGIKVYFYNGMSHVKAALYDDWVLTGTANFDKMSLFVNNEISLGIDDPRFVKEIETRLFEKDFSDSKLMEREIEASWTWSIINAVANQL